MGLDKSGATLTELAEKTLVGGFRFLRFPESLEQGFDHSYFVKSLTHLRAGFIVGTVIWMAFLFLDFQMEEARRDLAIVLRLAPLPYMAVLFFLSYQPIFERYQQQLLGSLVLFASVCVIGIIAIHDEPELTYHQGAMWLVIIPFYTIFRLRFYRASFYVWIVTIIYLVFFSKVIGSPPELIVHNGFMMVSMNLFGMFTAYTMEYFERLDYLNRIIVNYRRKQSTNATMAKDRFLSFVVYNLREPLARIAGLLQLVGKGGPLVNNEEKRNEIVERVVKTAKGQTELIDRLSGANLIRSGKRVPARRMFEVRPFLSPYVEQARFKAQKKGVVLHNHLPSARRLCGDRDLIGILLGELLANAVKYCQKDDVITVFMPKDHECTIAVSDTGSGIPSEMREGLFDHDVLTVSIDTDGREGAGLGLPLAADIMKAHGGSLTVDTQAGEGSTFYATFPDEKPLLAVVSDLEPERAILRHIVEKSADVEVMEVSDGETALERFRLVKPGAILVANHVPGMENMELLRSIKSDPFFKDLPVALIATEWIEEERQKARAIGVATFFSRPINEEEFIAFLKKYLY